VSAANFRVSGRSQAILAGGREHVQFSGSGRSYYKEGRRCRKRFRTEAAAQTRAQELRKELEKGPNPRRAPGEDVAIFMKLIFFLSCSNEAICKRRQKESAEIAGT
jgi:hypothetical protein